MTRPDRSTRIPALWTLAALALAIASSRAQGTCPTLSTYERFDGFAFAPNGTQLGTFKADTRCNWREEIPTLFTHCRYESGPRAARRARCTVLIASRGGQRTLSAGTAALSRPEPCIPPGIPPPVQEGVLRRRWGLVRGEGLWWVLAVLMAMAAVEPSEASDRPDGDLPRRGVFGAVIGPVPESVCREQKLDPGAGVRVWEVHPGTMAEEAGLKPGDLILAINGAPIAGPPAFFSVVRGLKTGERVEVTLVRDGGRATKVATFQELPRESSDAYDVIYGSVTSRGNRLRTIVTRPRGEGRFPALFLIQALGAFSIDYVPGLLPESYRAILDDLTRSGFVTLRVDKSGSGDSEGGPTRDHDFETELDGYRQALRAIKGLDFVDPDNVLICGHSMGAVLGPLLARETAVKGIAAYGTAVKTWIEYMLESTRRQMTMVGDDPAEIDSHLRREAAILHYVLREKRPPREVADVHPELRADIEKMFVHGLYSFGQHYTFFQQLADMNLTAAWADFDGHVLALWGEGEFVTSRDDHALIARIVDRKHPGHGMFRALPGIDHLLQRAATPEESYRQLGQPRGEFNPIIIDALRGWLLEVTRDIVSA